MGDGLGRRSFQEMNEAKISARSEWRETTEKNSLPKLRSMSCLTQCRRHGIYWGEVLNPTGTEGFVWVALSYFQMPRERKSSLMSCSVLCERSLERRHRPRHLENQTDNNEWLVLRTCWLFTQNSIKVTRSQKKKHHPPSMFHSRCNFICLLPVHQ